MAMETAPREIPMAAATDVDPANNIGIILPPSLPSAAPIAQSIAGDAIVQDLRADGPGDFEIFFSNPHNVPEEKQMPYIMMMATDCIEGFDVNKVHPYSTFLNNRKLAGGGWVRKLNANKDLVVQELKRRDPMARPNKSNRGSEELVKLFPPIIDLRDIAFITKKEGEFRRKMMNTLNECEMKPKRGRNSVGGQSSASPASTPFKRPRIDANLCVNLGGNIAGGSQNVQPNGTILSSQAADKVMASAEQLALDYGWKVSIAISDANGNPIMVKRVNDAYPASFEMAVAKAKTAAQFGRTGPGDFHDVSRGGLAIAIDNVCCGGIGVSGEKPAKLELIANAGIDALRTDELTGDDLEV